MNSGRQARGPLYAYVGGGSSIFVCDAGWVSSVRVFAGLVPRSSGSFRWSPSALIVGGMVVAAGGTSPISAIQFVSVVSTCLCLQFIKLSTPRDKMATSQLRSLDPFLVNGYTVEKSAAPDARSLQDPAKDPRLKVSGRR